MKIEEFWPIDCGAVVMIKQKLTIATIIATLLAPMAVCAKGKPANAILLKYANGLEIGRVIGMGSVSWPYVLTNKGYRALFRLGTGMIYAEAPLYYESDDCTGQAFTGGRSPGSVFMPTLDDAAAYASGAIYYSPNDAQAVTITVYSRTVDPLACIPEVSTREVYPAYINDPAITGIENTAYPTRMLIE
jgi:hypothetical protein